MSTIAEFNLGTSRSRIPAVLLLLALALCWLANLPQAQAQNCWSSGSPGLNFGTVSRSANTDTTATVPFTCQSGGSLTHFTVCLFIPAGNQSQGVDPRRMTNYNNSYVLYNLYSDPARTQIIGPPPSGGGYTVYAQSFSIPAGYQQQVRHFQVHARVPPVPNDVVSGSYQEGIGNIMVRYAHSTSGAPATCFLNPGGSVGVYMGTSATVPSGCTIGIGQANDLNFGSVSSLSAPVDGLSSISLNCPANTSWRLGLSNGSHASGSQRRMQGPAGNHVQYELYRNAARTLRWGNDTAGGSDVVSGSGSGQNNPTVIPVYGRVPGQALVAPGNYSDTITVTLIY